MRAKRQEVQVKEGEIRRRCPKCGLWGRRSPNPRRSDYHWNADKFHPHCRDCHNKRLRAAYLRKHGGYVRPRTERTLVDDYGIEVRVRRCRLCFRWLEASRELFALRRGGLSSECRTCCRARLADYRRKNREHVRASNRRSYANRAIDRFLKAEQEGRVFKPRLEFKAQDRWLPVEPFSEWLKETIPRFDELNKYGVVDGGITRLAEAVGCSERHVRRLRDGQHSTVRLSDVLVFLEVTGGAVEDIWPDYETAIEEGFRRRFENQHVPNRAAA